MSDALFRQLKNKLHSLIGKGVITAIKSDGGLIKAQIHGRENEILDDCEYYEAYGFSSVPNIDAEGVLLLAGANRPIIISMTDRRYRPNDLKMGDVCVYGQNGDRILIHADGHIDIQTKRSITMTAEKNITINGKGLELTSNSVHFTAILDHLLNVIKNLKCGTYPLAPDSLVAVTNVITELNQFKGER